MAVKQHGKGYQISFWWNGKRHRPTLSIAQTPRNEKYAENLLGEINRYIYLGQYTLELYAKHFPTSRIARGKPQAPKTAKFSDAAKNWLATVSHLAPGTKKKYEQDLQFWIDNLGETEAPSITYSLIAALANKNKWSPKYRNNMLIPLRGVLEMLRLDGVIAENPADAIKNAKVQKEPPDPFEIAEVELILNHMRAKYPEQAVNYYEFAFFTGLRPEEQIALKWSEVDFNKRLARIKRVRTASEDSERTKTHSIRDVELNSRALAALNRQKAYTMLKEDGYVFHNPNTGRRWNSEQAQRRTNWIPTLKALGIRYRTQYNTRHTFATMNLMAGANPMWVSRQMGHKNMQMLLTTYARWIDGADKSKERSKIDALFEDHSHKTATKEQNAG
jgi:integrase